MQKIKQVPIRHLRVVILKNYLHYAHCTSASSLVTKTPSAVARVVLVVVEQVSAGRVEVA